MKRTIETSDAPGAVGPYSQGQITSGFIYTSGQIALTAQGVLIQESLEAETNQVMKNLEAILAAGLASFSNVVKTTMYLTDVADYPAVNQVYSDFFAPPYPARECVGVKELPLGARIEISMIAERGPDAK